MARKNQTEMAVLGALSVMPMSGYAVRSAIRDVLGHFWSESFGQIYPALSRLERRGLVRRTGSKQTGSSLFSTTRAGEKRLRELLAEPIQPEPPRKGLMLRLFFGRWLGPEKCKFLLKQAMAEAEAQLAGYVAIREEILRDDEVAEDRPYWLLTVTAGERAARSVIAWAEEATVALDQIEQQSQRRRREG